MIRLLLILVLIQGMAGACAERPPTVNAIIKSGEACERYHLLRSAPDSNKIERHKKKYIRIRKQLKAIVGQNEGVIDETIDKAIFDIIYVPHRSAKKIIKKKKIDEEVAYKLLRGNDE